VQQIPGWDFTPKNIILMRMHNWLEGVTRSRTTQLTAAMGRVNLLCCEKNVFGVDYFFFGGRLLNTNILV